MRFSVLSLHPEMIQAFASEGILHRACESQKIQIDTVQIRDFAEPPHYRVDDKPFGGGPGMILQPAPLVKALRSVCMSESYVVVLSARGAAFTQQKAVEFSKYKHLVLISGRYEGIDQRIADYYAHEELRIGDFVMMGGEIAAAAVIEATARLVPGVLQNEESIQEESFSHGSNREAPQYTRPRDFEGHEVPEVLVGGNHRQILSWRKSFS
jgi:tRNA (guanine37-N1)-methyltransferase